MAYALIVESEQRRAEHYRRAVELMGFDEVATPSALAMVKELYYSALRGEERSAVYRRDRLQLSLHTGPVYGGDHRQSQTVEDLLTHADRTMYEQKTQRKLRAVPGAK